MSGISKITVVGNASMKLVEEIKRSVKRCFNSVKFRVVLKSNVLFPPILKIM